MTYDYIITKPELNEETLAHYGVLGMKWGHRKLDRQLARSKKDRVSTMTGRANHKINKNARFDKRINRAKSKGNNEKVKTLQSKKRAYNKDFDKGTEYIEKAYNKYDSVLKNYKKTQDKAIADKSTKKTSDYKIAKKEYRNQKRSNAIYGRSGTTLGYATDIASGRHNYTYDTAKLRKKYKAKYGK